MSTEYEIVIRACNEVHTLPDAWNAAALRELLVLSDMDDVSELADTDLLDMALMTLQDLDEQLAGELVLEAVFRESMRPGVRQNTVDDLEEDQPWNDVAEMSQQRGIFVTMVLLHQAFPRRYDIPDALEMEFTVTEKQDASFVTIESARPQWLVRLLAAGLEDRDILIRLYDEEISKGPFTDAAHIIWHHSEVSADDHSRTYRIISSRQWFSSLGTGTVFKARIQSS